MVGRIHIVPTAPSCCPFSEVVAVEERLLVYQAGNTKNTQKYVLYFSYMAELADNVEITLQFYTLSFCLQKHTFLNTN